MNDPDFISVLRAAESGEAKFPASPKTGLQGAHEKLERAKQILFGEGDGLDELFEALTTVEPGSPLAARAVRLRLLRKHRGRLKKAFEGDSPLAVPLYETLAAGPGPTMAKRRFAGMLNTPALVNSASVLRRSLSEKAFEIYTVERDWLKEVGPSRKGAKLSFFEKYDLKSAGLAIAGLVVLVVIIAGLTAARSGSRDMPAIPVAVIIWPAILVFRSIRSK